MVRVMVHRHRQSLESPKQVQGLSLFYFRLPEVISLNYHNVLTMLYCNCNVYVLFNFYVLSSKFLISFSPPSPRFCLSCLQLDNFVYLGSIQSDDDGRQPDIKRRIVLASSVMSSLQPIWSDRYLSLPTKVRVYQTLVQLFYCIHTRARHGHCQLLTRDVWRHSI